MSSAETFDRSRGHASLWFYGVAALLPLLCVPYFGTSYREIKIVALWLVGAMCGASLLIRAQPVRYAFGHVVVLCLVLWCLILLPSSVNKGLALQSTFAIVASLAVSLYVTNSSIRLTAYTLSLMLPVSIVMIGILAYSFLGVRLLDFSHPMGTFIGERNSASVFLVQILPFVLALTLINSSFHSAFIRIASGILAIGMVLCVILTRTRSAWVVLFFYAICILFLTFTNRTVPLYKRLAVTYLAVTCAALILTYALPSQLKWRSTSPYLDSLTTLTTLEHSSGRGDLWTLGALMLAERPLAGFGPGNYPTCMRSFIPRSGIDPKKFAFLRADLPLLNDYLQSYVELGVFGGSLFLFIAIGVPLWLLVKLRNPSTQPVDPFSIMATLSCLGLSINGICDYPFNRPETLFFFVVSLGIASKQLAGIHMEVPARSGTLVGVVSISSVVLLGSALAFGSSLTIRAYTREELRAPSVRLAWTLWPWDKGWSYKEVLQLSRSDGSSFAGDVVTKLEALWPDDPSPRLARAELDCSTGAVLRAFHGYEKALFQVPGGRCFRPAKKCFEAFLRTAGLPPTMLSNGSRLLGYCAVVPATESR
jgi:O-antigen ligase